MIATNLTSICCVYKEKIVKDVSYRITWCPYKYHLDRKKINLISNKSFRYYNLFIPLKAGILHTKPHISLTLRLNIWLEKNYFERGKIILGKTYYTIHQELKPDDYLRTKELSFSHKFKFSNPYIFATRW